MKTILSILLMASSINTSIYDFELTAIDGTDVAFTRYKGKNLLLVNVASKCGFTPQYADLQKLNDEYGSKITILGFPANNFGDQEPGSNMEIASFCEKNYGVTFQMFEKISVKGEDQHPLYQWLKAETGKEPTWNFCKYLIKADGTVKFFPSNVNPMDQAIIYEIK
jgi:glutathione peroxidase